MEVNHTTRRFWPEGSKWSGAAVVGDYIGLDGNIYEIRVMPEGIALRATGYAEREKATQ